MGNGIQYPGEAEVLHTDLHDGLKYFNDKFKFPVKITYEDSKGSTITITSAEYKEKHCGKTFKICYKIGKATCKTSPSHCCEEVTHTSGRVLRNCGNALQFKMKNLDVCDSDQNSANPFPFNK